MKNLLGVNKARYLAGGLSLIVAHWGQDISSGRCGRRFPCLDRGRARSLLVPIDCRQCNLLRTITVSELVLERQYITLVPGMASFSAGLPL